MSAGIYNIYIEQGSTLNLPITIKDDSGVVIDLTGSTFAGKIRTYPSSPTVIASFTITVPDPTTGVINVGLSNTQTAAIAAPTTVANPENLTQYFYDIEWTKADATVSRLLQGQILVSPEVTY